MCSSIYTFNAILICDISLKHYINKNITNFYDIEFFLPE